MKNLIKRILELLRLRKRPEVTPLGGGPVNTPPPPIKPLGGGPGQTPPPPEGEGP